MAKAYTGVDIGAEVIKLAVCENGVVKKIVIETMPEGLVSDGRVVSYDALADFLKTVAKANGGLAKNAAFIVPDSECLVRRISIPAMTEKELEINLPYEFRDYISQGKDRYTYDYAVLSSQNDEQGVPQSMEILGVACPNQTIEDFLEMFHRAGMKLAIALPSQAAFQNLVLGNPKASQNCAIIEPGSTSTKIYFFANGSYDVVRTIEQGEVDIDRVIAGIFSVDNHVARSYRVNNYQDVLQNPQVKDVYESIAVEIGRAFSFYSFNNPNVSIDTAYYCVAPGTDEPLLDLLQERIEVSLAPITSVMPDTSATPDYRALCSAAIGATYQG